MLPIKLALLAMAGPLTLVHASSASYGVSDCGMYGSIEYQACQGRIAAGELAYLGSHVPSGIPWDPSYLASLPPLTRPYHRYFALAASEDSRWIVVGDHDEDTDSRPAYLWHDGTFTSALDLPPVDATGFGGWISINDQGTIAIGRGAWPVWFSPLGDLNHESPPSGTLNDANQLLFRDTHTWENFLYAPAPPPLLASRAVAPVPEPLTSSLALIGVVIIWLRRIIVRGPKAGRAHYTESKC